MNLLQIALTAKCNLHCAECPMSEFLNKQDNDWEITNVRLIPFLYKYVDPKKWFIELTGGEPAMYPELPELLKWLTVHQYRGLIKTNGLLPIPKGGHFPRISAWHGDSVNEMFPKYYDQILLIYGIQDYQKKAEYCAKHKIPFQTVGLNKDSGMDNVLHHIQRVSFINAVGQVLVCPAAKATPKPGKYGDMSMIDFSKLVDHDACCRCKIIQDFWRFIEPSWRAQGAEWADELAD